MRTIAIALLTCLFAPAAFCQEWTRFRGPNGTGIGEAPDLPAVFSEKDFLWKVALPGTGHSSPVLWGKRLFVTCADQEKGTRIVACLDADTGGLLWKREYPSPTFRQHADNSYASSSPAVDGERVYAYWTTPTGSPLVALDHEGKELWKIDLGPYKAQHGSGASPIVCGELVILGNDQEGSESFLLAVERATGRTRWKIPRESTSTSTCTPFLYEPAGGRPQLIFTSRSEGVAAVDVETGKVIWQLKDAMDRRVVSSPILAGGLVIATCGEGGVGRTLVAARPGDGNAPPSIAWQIKNAPPYVPTPLTWKDLLYLWTDSGLVWCVRPGTGETVWQEKLRASFYSSPVLVNGRLYNISKQGEVFVVELGENHRVLGTVALGDKCFSTPAIAHGRMYIRTCKSLICVGR